MTDANLVLEIDVTDPPYRILAAFGGRLDALLQKPKVRADDNLAGTLDEFLGALYALTLARVQGFVDRPAGTPIELLVLQKRSAQLAHGRVRLEGKWMAGFHFNSALLRLAAVYHRGLKILTGDIRPRVYVGDLLKTLQPDYTTWTGHTWSNANINRLHDEVNDLKHTPQGLFGGRSVAYAEAVAAVGELLELFEAWPHLR